MNNWLFSKRYNNPKINALKNVRIIYDSVSILGSILNLILLVEILGKKLKPSKFEHFFWLKRIFWNYDDKIVIPNLIEIRIVPVALFGKLPITKEI